jgi:hypothetical protein
VMVSSPFEMLANVPLLCPTQKIHSYPHLVNF